MAPLTRAASILLTGALLLAPIRAAADKPLFVVTDSPYEIWKGSQTKVHVVVFGPGFKPIEGAKVFAGENQVGVTDPHGTLVFSHRPRGGFVLRAETTIDGEPAAGTVFMEAYRRTSSFESANLFVYTDRGVYRPGEEILLRLLAWRLRADFFPIQKAKVEVVLTGPGSALVTGDELTTDAFGITATRLRIPEDAREGDYALVVRYRDAEETARLRVERFRPPAIQIRHNLPRFIAPSTPDLPVKATLSYFTGGAPAAGSFDVKAVYQGKELFRLNQKIVKGQAQAFNLPLDPIRKVVPDQARFQVHLAATDGFGRSDEVKRDILFAKRPYTAVPDLDKDVYAKDEEVNLSVRLTDPDGVPVRKQALTLEGDQARIKLEATTDDGGVAVFKFAMPDRSILVTVRSSDVPTPLFSRNIQLIESKPMQATLPKPVVRERRFMPLTITFDPGFIPVESVVHVDVTDYSGAVVGCFQIPIRRKKGRYVARGRFKAPSWGSMLLTMFAVGMDREDRRRGRRAGTVGLLTEGLSLTSHPDKELQVHLDGLPDEAPPRSELNVRFQVKDPRGRAPTSSLGVMLVDRAVLSLLDPLEKTPMDRFYNPTLKVLSTTGSDILTWPVVSRNWGYDRMDIALPPFGFLEGGPVALPGRRLAKASPGVLGYGAAAGSGTGGFGSVAAPMAKVAPAKQAKAAPTEMEPMMDRGDAAPEADSSRRGRRAPRPATKPRPRILIRTDLPETSVWEPGLVARNGKASLSIKLPEALTEQELIVVASDKKGGIGLVRKQVRVTQPLFVRSDLPRTMVSGDKARAHVFVKNSTRNSVDAEVSLVAKGVSVEPASRRIKIEAESSAIATFSISASDPGSVDYVVEARAGKHSDAEKRKLEIRPRGSGKLEELQATLTAKDPFEGTIHLGKDDYVEAHLEIAFPTILPALQEIEKLLGRTVWWSDSFLATPLAAAQLERYLARHLPRHPRRQELRSYLARVASLLSRAANPDGGFSWWRTGPQSNLFATAHALRLMAALRDADIRVEREAFLRAADCVRQRLPADGLWKTDDIAFWEGSTEKVRWQVSASIFRSLAEAARVERKLDRGWIEELGGRFAKYLDDGPDDVLTAAEAALGLFALEQTRKRKLKGKARERLHRAASQLVAMRKQTHWEPSWFHAYGGTIEATVASLELLSRLDRRAFENEIRSGLTYLLSTRGEWGMWHCPFGTAEAVRAFTFLPPPKKEIPSTVSVLLGGKEVARVKISPRDPFLSAIQLRHLALGSKLQPGANPLTVRYDGRLDAPVRLVVHRWGKQPEMASGSARVAIERSLASARIGVGEPVEVTLKLSAARQKGELRVVSPIPSNAGLGSDALQKLRMRKGVLKASRQGNDLELLIQGGSDQELRYTIEGLRTGTATLEPVRVSSTRTPGLGARTGTDRLEVN